MEKNHSLLGELFSLFLQESYASQLHFADTRLCGSFPGLCSPRQGDTVSAMDTELLFI